MAFLDNIPLSTDRLSTSQGNILNNFAILGAIAGNANPSSGSINATSGFNWIYLPTQGATPPAGAAFPNPAAGSVGLYSFVNAITSRNELYINKKNQATVVQIPATASILNVTSAPAVNSNGWTYLPSGILMKWGFVAITPATPSPIAFTFPAGATIPAFQQIFNLQLTNAYNSTTAGNNSALNVSYSTVISTTGFTITFNLGTYNNSSSLYYLAIGY